MSVFGSGRIKEEEEEKKGPGDRWAGSLHCWFFTCADKHKGDWFVGTWKSRANAIRLYKGYDPTCCSKQLWVLIFLPHSPGFFILLLNFNTPSVTQGTNGVRSPWIGVQGLFMLRQQTMRQSTALEVCNRTPMRLLDSPGHFRLEKLTSSKKGGSPEVHPLAFGKLLLEPNPTLSPSSPVLLGGVLPLYGLLFSSITVILG